MERDFQAFRLDAKELDEIKSALNKLANENIEARPRLPLLIKQILDKEKTSWDDSVHELKVFSLLYTKIF